MIEHNGPPSILKIIFYNSDKHIEYTFLCEDQ